MKKKLEYNHLKIESKWQKNWESKKVYKTETHSKKKPYYVLDMFPYPSGQGLHVGHPRGYIGSDVFARFKRMQGFNVLHPMGFDAFGLPAEQYAIQTGKHPSIITRDAVKRYKKQLEQIGFSYDWNREVQTIDPDYYKWTQFIFLKIYNSFFDVRKQKARHIDELIKIFEKEGNNKVNEYVAHSEVNTFSKIDWNNFSPKEQQDVLMKYRLAYEGYAEVNWCKELGTVLANDEVLEKDGKLVSERGEYPVEKKSMRQWFMRISAYGDRLLSGLEKVDFEDSTKETQKNWIGKSEGSEIEFNLKLPKQKILIGTRNQAKFKMLTECFPKNINIEFVNLNDLDVDDSTLTEGQDFEENARMKAEFYFKKTGIPTISLDNVFWIKKWPKDNGVMIHMRKEANPESPRATDEEVVSFFQKWLDVVGGESEARFKYAVAYTSEQGTQCFSSIQRKYILQKEQSKNKHNFWAGYPTESLLIDVKTGEYKGEQVNEVRYNILIQDLEEHAQKWFEVKRSIEVFTTRADTLFGVTYVVLAPEHVLVENLLTQCTNRKEVEKYIESVKNKTQEERTQNKEKTGVCLQGVYAINPVNDEEVPVWIADYVLASYGTGAVMAVPAHDERDYEFAKKYNLLIKSVVFEKNAPVVDNAILDTLKVFFLKKDLKQNDFNEEILEILKINSEIQNFDKATINYGFLVNSNQFDGLTSEEAKKKITEFVGGKLVTKYKMRDAIFARQRYWGEPIPLIHDKKTGLIKEVPLSKLPLKLPNVQSYKPTGTGDSPLASVKSWKESGYETNTMPGWAGSSWYFLRYMDPQNKKVLVGDKALQYWKNVDMYVGGTEHNTGHLLYARFWHKVLFDLGIVKTEEPFKALRHQGMIGGADGRKMSKRWGNVVNPDDVVQTYGADTLRVFEMFLGPFDAHLPWSEDGIIGSRRFIERVYRLLPKVGEMKSHDLQYETTHKVLHKTVKKVTEDIQNFGFNTAVSAMMILLNEFEKVASVDIKDFKQFLQILAPFAPHVSEELWVLLGEKQSIHLSHWPKFDAKKIVEHTKTIGVQINGKVRGEVTIDLSMSEEKVKQYVLEDSTIKKYLDKPIKKFIYVQGKIISIVL